MPKVVPGYKEEAKRTIVQTAAGIFAEKGLHETTMDDVAEKLGVSKGAVYQYFPSKDALFQELCGTASKKVEETLRAHFTGGTVREAAESYIDAELDRMEQGLMIMFEAIAECPRNAAVKKMMRSNYSTISEVLAEFLEGLKGEGRLRKDIDAESAAKFLIALRHGVLVSRVQGLPREDAKKVWLTGFDYLLSGSL
ncbi:MAG: TetR/AcrR family transcriptional regulator [Nitrososphaerota archaeon]|nr:TetR/AcrR family transcriptional regulator [Nitrososphaerota archaeon]MDG6978291.1 TetR/AcrR family transcriptional regulator [Nitrososphaerota archaeon]MDG7005886.1 TetR/AcrR family transcriptional regulator [Nitrososphaerota archaeon]MDG7021614.1 TetR/AcrR family transcriptional regulator [Nitrososphaerota archaeon]